MADHRGRRRSLVEASQGGPLPGTHPSIQSGILPGALVETSVALAAVAAALAFAFPGGALAQGAAVTFDEALALGAASPRVAAERREHAAREAAEEEIGGTAQATTLTFMPGGVLNPDLVRGFDTQMSLTQGWNLGGLGGARRRAATGELEVISAQIRAQALGARLEAARRWIDLWALQRVETLLEAQEAIAAQRLERSERALELGVGGAQAVAEAGADVAALAQHRLEVEGERVWATNQLAVAMGRSPAHGLRADGPLPAPVLPDDGAIRARIEDLERLPELAVRRLAATAARAREEEVRAHYAPTLTLGGQVERGSLGAWTVYGIASLSLNAFDQDGRAVSLARAAAAREDAEFEVALVQARADAEDAVHEVQHSRRQLAAIASGLLPALTALVERHEAALAAGEGTIFALLDARRRALAAEEARVRAAGAKAWAEVRLWLLLAELQAGGDA